MKKGVKLSFGTKNRTPRLGVLDSSKKFQVFEKKNVWKKIFSVYLCWFYLKLISRFWELFFTIRLLTKREGQENQENSAHHFGDNYLTNHLLKFVQDRIKNNSLMRVLELPLTYRVIQVNYIKAHYIQVVVKVNEPRYIALFVLSRSI